MKDQERRAQHLRETRAQEAERVAAVQKKRANMVEKQAKRLDWQTPPEVLDPIRNYFDGYISFDPCTTEHNPVGAMHICTPEMDGLRCNWNHYDNLFINPPYGKHTKAWMEKAKTLHKPAVWLLPANRWETDYLQEFARHMDGMVLVRRRVKFIDPSTGERGKSNIYGSVLWLQNAWNHLGNVPRLGTLGQVIMFSQDHPDGY